MKLPERRADGLFQDLYDHQKRMVREASARLGEGHAAVMCVAPTGSGKGLLAVEMTLQAVSRGLRVLFVVHRSELVLDFQSRLADVGFTDVDVIAGGVARLNPHAPVHAANIASLAKGALPSVDLVIIDEGHRSLAPGYVALRERLQPKWVIGLTGTPVRLDRKSLSAFYGAMVVGAQPRELIDAGLLAASEMYSVPDDLLPDLQGVDMRGSDYKVEELSQRVNTKKLVGSLVDHWLRRAENRATVVFCVDVEHANEVAKTFCAAGIAAESIDGLASQDERKALMKRVRSGETVVVSMCNLWVEGVNLPELKCAILARPTLSLTVFLQSCGRILRVWRGVLGLILDHVALHDRFGECSDDRDWEELWKPTSKPRKSSTTPRKARACPGLGGACLRVTSPGVLRCPACGHEFKAERVIETVEGDLVRVGGAKKEPPGPDSAAARQAFERFWKTAYREGQDKLWVARHFIDRFGAAPPADFAQPPRPVVDEPTRRKMLNGWLAAAHRNKLPHAWVEQRYLNAFGITLAQAQAPLLALPQGAAEDASAAPTAASVVASHEPIEAQEF